MNFLFHYKLTNVFRKHKKSLYINLNYFKKGVNIDLIKRLLSILIIINSYYEISINSFKEYCMNTAKLFNELYSWFYMPCSLHKILIHGHLIINALDLPIGAYSEEAQESRNKDNKNYRLNHSFKGSRIQTFTDQINYLLLTSDPKISDLIIKGINKKKEIKLKPLDVLTLIDQSKCEKYGILEYESSSNDESLSSNSSILSMSSSNDEDDNEMRDLDENNNDENFEDIPDHF
jgi:hypothetical protein